MRLLSFQARRFAWERFEPNLPGAEVDGAEAGGEVAGAVVVFVHAEAKDEVPEERARVFRRTLKHVKWLAGKRGLRTVVLHSFAHLGGESAAPDFALGLLDELAERLEKTGYRVERTPFGWFSSWELAVHGESLAKVWKEF